MKARLGLSAALVGLVLAGAGMVYARRFGAPAPLPVLGTLPDVHLVDSRGAPFERAAMQGHLTVVDFFFTRCTSSCPRLTARMGDLQAWLQARQVDARLLSISVDPENDTPPVLAQYAERAHADPQRWSFVTGPPAAIEQAVVGGFKLAATKAPRAGSDYDVIHGDWFVLSDSSGRLRGYYRVDTPEDLAQLEHDIVRLERER